MSGTNALSLAAAAEADRLWAERFWTKQYRPGVPPRIEGELARWTSVQQMFEADSRRFAERPGYVSLGTALTYGQVLAAAKAFGAWLQSVGIQPGDRVALMMPNGLQYPTALFGVLFAGAVVVNVNPLYTPRELHHQLKDSGAVAIVVMDMFARTLELAREGTEVRHVVVTAMGDMMPGLKGVAVSAMMRHVQKLVPAYHLPGAHRWKSLMRRARRLTLKPVATKPEDIAFLQYTGGTSGVAKGAMLTHRNILANTIQGRVWILDQIDQNAPLGNVTMLPLYHIFSLTANLMMFTGAGGRNILIANPRDAKRVEWILRKERFVGMTGLNTLFSSLLKTEAFRNRDFSDLKLTIAGGMATQKVVAEEWEAVTGAPLVDGYGLTETSPVVCIGRVDLEHPETMGFDGTVGLPVPSTEVRMRRDNGTWAGIDEPGELCVRGPQVMLGYWKRPDETAKVISADGWLATGDVGVMQADGRVRLVDRIKDMILVSGFNVYPGEIEDVVASHPLVEEVAAVGVPDPVQGEKIKIVVVPRSPELTAEMLIAHCRGQLTAYKTPRLVEFRSEPLPKTPVGKVLRRELR
ncbi:AMP-binding protein [uncultured Brevundimonas sp.]|uniref:AMP-binding protein n=1 Tax=uncultured Brevundimonas sp. TaxID=213418 RepID=UPI0025F6D13F|nr:AMP-binding protein [uncultured Brevundimonas sp.]